MAGNNGDTFNRCWRLLTSKAALAACMLACLLVVVLMMKGDQFRVPSTQRKVVSALDTEFYYSDHESAVQRVTVTPIMESMNTSCSLNLPENKYFHTYCDYYQPVLQPSYICSPNTELVIGIITSGKNFETRTTFRQSVLSEIKGNASIAYFFLLAKSNDVDITAAVQAEAAKYNDIVVANFIDSYENLTLKSSFLLRYSATMCPTAEYTFKLDDDVYCNIGKVQQELARRGPPLQKIYGSVFDNVAPIHDISSKWHVDHYFEKYFPRYVSGTAYIITQDLLPTLYVQAMTEPFIRIEDAFITGICAKDSNLKIQHVNIAGFRYNPVGNLKQIDLKNALTIHQLTPQQITAIWQTIHK